MVRLYKLQVDFIPEDKIVSLVQVMVKTKDREQKIRVELLTSMVVKIIKQVIYTIIITYVLGCAWYFMSDQLNPSDAGDTFISVYKLQSKSTVD
mmetsp:Transcript_34745/g.25891  ORF Transcript_34745/g.25891 Transcript_34745/m.25891 type:complete len:94 (-) Transcript_34745:324-605(-)